MECKTEPRYATLITLCSLLAETEKGKTTDWWTADVCQILLEQELNAA